MIGIGIAIPLTELRAASGMPTDQLYGWYKKGTASGASWPSAGLNTSPMQLVGSPTIAGGSVTFNGTTQYGYSNSGSTFDFSVPFTLYMRVKQVAWADGNTLFDVDGGAGIFQLLQSSASPGVDLTVEGSDIGAQNSVPVGSFKSLAMGTNNGQTVVFFQVSGSAEATTGGPPPSTGGEFYLACSNVGAFANITVTELMIYNTEHTAAQRAAVLAYLDTL